MAFFTSYDRDSDLFVPFSIFLLVVIFISKVGARKMINLLLLNIPNRSQIILMNICYNHNFSNLI